jgi:DNA polymerase III subunit alpha
MSPTQKTFVHLHVHSAYSLAEGAIKIKDLVKLCLKNNMPAVAVTDSSNLFGAMEFAQEASKAGIQPIIGCQMQMEEHQIVLLVQNQAGYMNLSRIVSDAYMGDSSGANIRITREMLKQNAGGLICLSGGMNGAISQALLHRQIDKAKKEAEFFTSVFGDRFYIEIQRHNHPDEKQVEPALIDLAYELNIPLVAANDCYFTDRAAHEAHDALLCIAEGRYITEEDRRKVTPEHYFKNSAEMIKLFEDLPEAILNTVVIAQRCAYLLKSIAPILPPFQNENKRPEAEELAAQSKEGLLWRLEKFVFKPGMKKKEKAEAAKPYHDRLDFELNVINGMGYPGYFLICSDFIKWAKTHNIPVGPGRGSGAGSVVAWALQILIRWRLGCCSSVS